MNEDLVAAFSPLGLAHQLAFLLLLLAVVSSSVRRMRMLAGAAALVGFAQAFAARDGVVEIGWWALVFAAAALLVLRDWYENSKVRFTEEEERMASGPLAELSRAHARHLIDQGFWLTGKEGDVLTREREPVTHLFYLSDGEARVTSSGRQVATCTPGDLIGEVSVLSGDSASATVVLAGPARFWCAPADVLRPYVQTHDEVRRALEKTFTASLRSKLKATNERLAEVGPAAV